MNICDITALFGGLFKTQIEPYETKVPYCILCSFYNSSSIAATNLFQTEQHKTLLTAVVFVEAVVKGPLNS